MWICLSLLISIPFSKGSDVDTLEVQYTVHHGPGGKRQFQQTTLFNGHVIFNCNSPTLRDQPRQEWVTQAFTQEELEERHQQCASQCNKHFASFEKIKQTITASADILQRRQGCVINSSLDEWGVNGEDFLTFDPDALKWTAHTDEANPLASEWDGKRIMNNDYKAFGNNLCRKKMKMKQAGRATNGAHTGMELLIFGKSIPGGTFTYLQCHVTGSSLSGVSIQLTKDGVPLDHGVNHTGPRPNGDGTVQMRVQVMTTMDHSKTYRCEVHSENFNKTVVFGENSVFTNDRSTHQITVVQVAASVIIVLVTCDIVVVCVIFWYSFDGWALLRHFVTGAR
ncbi:class I histocompatibility antigen, F10 alpha chain-like [Alosa sapidissima]|uniref:class I histocompatibility antigen, F10 alpha chain-like n=1 Tax=Alosa sapidissima TaxID=34773 RepID=UPI001C09CD10|nr:class I histocompatibility antigen, F10 alpha chain-like [Alosa sapidissima]